MYLPVKSVVTKEVAGILNEEEGPTWYRFTRNAEVDVEENSHVRSKIGIWYLPTSSSQAAL